MEGGGINGGCQAWLFSKNTYNPHEDGKFYGEQFLTSEINLPWPYCLVTAKTVLTKYYAFIGLALFPSN